MESDNWIRGGCVIILFVSVICFFVVPLSYFGFDFNLIIQNTGLYVGLIVDLFALVGIIYPERYPDLKKTILELIRDEGDKTRQTVEDSKREIISELKQGDSFKEEGIKDEKVIGALDKLARWKLIAKSYGKFHLLGNFVPIWGERGEQKRPFTNWEKIAIALLFEYPKRVGSKKLHEYTDMGDEEYKKTITMYRTHFNVSKNELLTLSPYGYNTILQTIEDIRGAKDVLTGGWKLESNTKPF